MFNTFGSLFRLTSFGESHGPGIGGVIDGCPAGIEVDEGFIQAELDKRKPNNAFAGAAGTTRNEADKIKILSGVYEGRTTGTPFAFLLKTQIRSHRIIQNLQTVTDPDMPTGAMI